MWKKSNKNSIKLSIVVFFVFLFLYANQTNAATVTWDANGATASQTDGTGAWLDISKWWNGATNVNWTSGDDAIFGNGGTGSTVTLASPTTVNSLVANNFGGTYTLGTAGQTITLTTGLTKNLGGTGALTIISPIVLGGAQTWLNNSTGLVSQNATTDNAGNLLTIDGTGNISFATAVGNVISGAGGLTKNGSGFLTIGGGQVPVHTYTGPTIINGGTVMQSTNNIPSGNITLNGGVLEGYWSTSFTRALGSGSNQIQIPGGVSGFSLNGNTGMSVILNNNAATEAVWGSAFFNPSTFALQTPTSQSGSAITFANNIDLNGAVRTIQVSGGTLGNAVANLSGVVRNTTGTAGLIKTGAGRLILSAANTYNGDTTISGGILQVGNNTVGNLGGGNYAGNISIASGSTLRIWGTGNQTLSGVISGAGSITKAYGGTLTLSGNNTYTGITSVVPQTTAGSTLSVSSFNSVNGGTPLMASSSMGAPTTIPNGTIQIGNGGAQSSNTLRYTGSGETTDRILHFAFNNGARQTLDASGSGLLKFTSTMTITPSSGNSTGGITFTGTGTGEMAGVIPIMPGTIQKTGNGTWTFSNANTYANALTITAGTLSLSHASNNNIASVPTITINAGANLNTTDLLDTDDLILASGQALRGSGTIIGNTTIASSTTVSPGATGASPGTMSHTGDVVYTSGGNYIWEINDGTGITGTNSDLQNITGALNITATSGNKFNIDIKSLTAGNVGGIMPDFDKYADYVWTIASTTGGITGFDSANFNLIKTNFTNDITGTGINGYFGIQVSGNNLQLTYTGAKDNVSLSYSAGPHGSLTGSVSQVIVYGGDGTAVTAVPDTGYSFVDWSDGSTENPRTDMSVLNDISVTANFEINQYTITLDSDGGTPVDPITADFDAPIVEPTPPTKPGYVFGGWNPALPDTMHPYSDTHTAIWTVDQFVITFDGLNGIPFADPIIDDFGATITPPPDPIREGYTFTGWNPPLPLTMPANNFHTHAQWSVNEYTLTFNSDGGSSVSPITQDYDTSITTPASPTKEGYTFAGWNPAVPSTMPAGDQTYIAIWTIDQFALTFNTDGGTVVNAILADFGTTIMPPTSPIKKGYTFLGWSPTLPSTMPATSSVHTALWEEVNSKKRGTTMVRRIKNLIDIGKTEQAQTLQKQYNAPNINIKPTSPSNNTSPSIYTRDLETGLSGEDVKSLQEFLMLQGYSIPAGATGYFGNQTKQALIAYQQKNAISPAIGYFGPITKANVGR